MHPLAGSGHTAAGCRDVHLLPPRSMVGQLPLEQPIGVRIPGGQPNKAKHLPFLASPKSLCRNILS